MSSWFIYGLTRLDGVNVFFMLSAIGFSIPVVVYLIYAFGNYIDDLSGITDSKGNIKKYFRKARKLLPLAAVWWILSILTPTSKEMAVIYLLPKVANNEKVKKVPDNVLKLLNVKVEAWIDQQMGKSNKEK